MNQMQDLVLRYAKLQRVCELSYARGQMPDPRVTAEILRIENFAKVRMTPEQIQATLHHVEVAKMHLMQHEQQSRRDWISHNANSRADNFARKLTNGIAGMNGLDREQMNAVIDGKGLTMPKRATQEQRDAIFRQRSKHIDPKGRGWNEAEYARRMDELAEANPENFRRLSGHYSADPRRLKQAVEKWRDDRYSYGLQRRREASDRFKGLEPANPVVTPSDRRKAVLARAMMEQTADSMEKDWSEGNESRDDFEISHSMPLEYLNETDNEGGLTRRATLARAYDAQEQAGFPED